MAPSGHMIHVFLIDMTPGHITSRVECLAYVHGFVIAC